MDFEPDLTSDLAIDSEAGWQIHYYEHVPEAISFEDYKAFS